MVSLKLKANFSKKILGILIFITTKHENLTIRPFISQYIKWTRMKKKIIFEIDLNKTNDKLNLVYNHLTLVLHS